MDGPTSSWCTPVLELRLSHACTNHAVLPGEWAELCKRCVEAATRRDEGILYGIVRRYGTVLYDIIVVNTSPAPALLSLVSFVKNKHHSLVTQRISHFTVLHW